MEEISLFLKEWSPTGAVGLLTVIAGLLWRGGVRFGRYQQWEVGEHKTIHKEIAELRGDVCIHNVTNRAGHVLLCENQGIPIEQLDRAEARAIQAARARKELRT